MSTMAIEALIPALLYRLKVILEDPDSTTHQVIQAGQIIAKIYSTPERSNGENLGPPIDEGSPFE